jgi:hypothetical protein
MRFPLTLAARAIGEQFSSAHDEPGPNAHSDHSPRQYYDLDNTIPIPPGERD